jgi:pimeloyl-ACP methyl ester carboxylesterase
MERVQIPVGDLVFDAAVDGPADGRLVLLLHGFPQSSRSWRRVVPALVDAGLRVVAPDQRGYSPGARPEGVAAYRMSELVGDVLGMLDHLGAERADVVGHDWGAAVAWQLAGRYPQRVRTLTAVSVPHPLAFVEALQTDEDQRRRSQYMRDWRHEGAAEQALLGGQLAQVFDGIPQDEAEHYLALMHEPGVLTKALNWYRAQSRDDVAGMPHVRVPTLHVWSDEDAALGRTGAEATAKYVDGPYRFAVLEGVSHWVPEQAPDLLAELVLAHLRTPAP